MVEEVKDEHKVHAAFRGRLRMDEVDDERRRKQKRAREDTRDQKTTFGTEEGLRKRRQAWPRQRRS